MELSSHQPAMNRLQFAEDLFGGFSNKEACGKLPDPLPNPLRLNLGCGLDVRKDYVNIDLFSENPEVVIMDVRKLDLPDNSVDEILASDILEHFSHRATESLLKEWVRVMKPGAELIIRCPSLRLQVLAYLNGVWDADIASYMIFGGQTNPGDYHCNAFDEKSIKLHLNKAGLQVLAFDEIDTPQDNGFINLNMTVLAKKPAIIENTISVNSNVAQQQAFDFDSETEEKEEDLFDFDFDFENITPEALQAINNETFSIDLLEELVAMDNQKTGRASKEEYKVSDGKQLNIVWEGSQFVYHSLALINREHCNNILKTGLAELSIVPYEQETFEAGDNPKYISLKENDVRYKEEPPEEITKLPYLWIRHQWPPKTEPPQGAKWVIIQPWEYSCLPKSFVELFNQADEIWTPSTFSRNSMVRSGVPFNKVQIIPNGIDPDLFKPNGSKYKLKSQKKLKYLFVGGTIFRKGIDILLESYVKAFTANDDVCLVIKDMGGDSFYKGQTAKQSIEAISSNVDAPEIEFIENYLTEEEMASLYRACDIFVSPYRGEGFSMPTLEAMACGLPVIVTEGGASDDYLSDDFAFRIPAEKLSLGNRIDNMEMVEEVFLLEPDADTLIDTLQQTYIHASIIKNSGIKASLKARTLWTWNRATKKIFSRIDMLYDKTLAIKAEKILLDYEDSNILLARGEIEYENSNYDSAKELLHLSLERSDLSDLYTTHALNRLATIYINEKNYSKALESIEKAKEIIPDNPDSNYLQAKIHWEQENWTDMMESIIDVFDNWKYNKFNSTIGIKLDDLLCDTAFAFYKDGDVDASLQLYTEALKVNNSNARACFGSAQCFKEAGAIEEAKTMLEWAVKLNPEYEDALNIIN